MTTRHRKQLATTAALVLSAGVLCLAGCAKLPPRMTTGFENYTLDYSTPADPALQANLEMCDASLRGKYHMTAEQTAVGVLDLQRLRLAMIHPDRIEYAASVPKVGILLAWFQLHSGRPDKTSQG